MDREAWWATVHGTRLNDLACMHTETEQAWKSQPKQNAHLILSLCAKSAIVLRCQMWYKNKTQIMVYSNSTEFYSLKMISY